MSILITHYNRYNALLACLQSIRNARLDFEYEIVVSDDASDSIIIDNIRKQSIDTLVVADSNEGLASNLNKGIKACRGNYILYVQEDFLMQPSFNTVFNESVQLLNSGKLDMIRYRANYRFNRLIPCTDQISIIPKFSFKNFNINTFRYSDHPFLTTPSFFETFGYYLDNTSVGYGETEFAIRIMNSKAKIGITSECYFEENKGVASTVHTTPMKRKIGFKKRVWRLARALRQHLEWLLYNPNRRKLYTYKNKRI